MLSIAYPSLIKMFTELYFESILKSAWNLSTKCIHINTYLSHISIAYKRPQSVTVIYFDINENACHKNDLHTINEKVQE